MLLTFLLLHFVLVALAAPQPSAKYRPLPSLREQDALERNWVSKRWAHVPSVLAKQ